MPNYFAIAFVGVLGCVGVGLEYQRQSVLAGVPMSEFGISGFTQSISDSVSSMMNERAELQAEEENAERWAVEMRTFLPEAPQGWTRRAFDEGDNKAIIPSGRSNGFPDSAHMQYFLMESGNAAVEIMGQTGVVRSQAISKKDKVVAKIITQSWVYERGGETVFIELRPKQPPTEETPENDTASALKQLRLAKNEDGVEEAPFGVIAGVPFYEVRNKKGNGLPAHFRMISARLGMDQEIHLRVHANADRQATFDILQAIDFAALNDLFRIPMSHVDGAFNISDGPRLEQYANAANYLRAQAKAQLAQERLQGFGEKKGAYALTPSPLWDIPPAWFEKFGAETSPREMLILNYRDGMKALISKADLGDGPLDMEGLMDDAYSALQSSDEIVVEVVEEEKAPERGSMAEPLKQELAASGARAKAIKQAEPSKAVAQARPAQQKVENNAKPRVKVNRLGNGGGIRRTAKKAGCGGGSFCKVGN